MINQHPDVIGNLEGVDYTSRNEANRIMLPRLKKQAEEELDAFVAKMNRPHMSGPEFEEFMRLSARVKALDAN